MQIQPLTSEGIIYFPTIEFQDDGWLKRALSIWERVYRIVPRDYVPNDSDEVKAAIDAGLVESIQLTEIDRKRTAEKFGKFWRKIPFIPAGLEADSPILIGVHEDKIDERIRPILDDLVGKIKVPGFIHLPKEVAEAYMFWLTEEVSRSRNLPKLSDNPDMFTIMQYFQNDAQISDGTMDADAREGAAALVLEHLIPAGIESSSIASLIEFRRRSEEGRGRFRHETQNFIGELARISDPGFATQLMTDYQNKLQSMREGIISSIKKSASEPFTLLVSIGLPASLDVITKLSNGDAFDGADVLGLLFIAIAAITEATKSRRYLWRGSEASYYFDLKHQFGEGAPPRPKIIKYSRLMEEFIND